MIQIHVPALIDALLQAYIALTGILGLGLVLRGGRWTKWGAAIGLAGQPAWLWCTAVSGQYGMLAAAIVMTVIWVQAVWEHIILPLHTPSPLAPRL